MRDGIQTGNPLTRLWHSFSTIGLLLGTVFFIASLTPTLIPRSYLTEGVLAGGCFAVGYGLGALLHWLWIYLALPRPRERIGSAIKSVTAVICGLIAIAFLWRTVDWQNSIRLLMGLGTLSRVYALKVCLIAIVTFLVLLGLGRLVGLMVGFLSARLRRFIPQRLSNLLALVGVVLLVWSIANGLLFRISLQALYSSYKEYDALLEPNRAQPASPLKTGSPASLLNWNGLGRAGREFIAAGPTAAEINAFTGKPDLDPIRVYVGLRASETAEERAKLALAELERVGAFDRSTLVIVTPTGTGWIDPAAMDSIEYLRGGDIASVALQYSYLSSPFSLLMQPEYGADSARALFAAVYGHWTSLPRDRRPKLYLHGLSLGSMNSERSVQLFEMLGDPVQGALWSGPPFENGLWRSFTNARNAGSSEWLPQFRDGSFVRFMNQNGPARSERSEWGPMRVVYLQYASDPVTFFSYSSLWRRPDWMASPRGPDVSPELRWYPVVTMLQLAMDMMVSTSTPFGYGHVFAPEHYVDAWISVTGDQGWSANEIARLKEHLAIRERRAASDPGSEVYADQGG